MTPEEIGDIRRRFKPGRENLVAGYIIGLLLMALGCGGIYLPVNGIIEARAKLPFWAEKGWAWGAAAGFIILGIGLIIGGVLLIRWMRSLGWLQVFVGEKGICVIERTTARVFAWDDIVSVQETHIHE